MQIGLDFIKSWSDLTKILLKHSTHVYEDLFNLLRHLRPNALLDFLSDKPDVVFDVELILLVLSNEGSLELHDCTNNTLNLHWFLLFLTFDNVVLSEELFDSFVDQVQRFESIDLENIHAKDSIILESEQIFNALILFLDDGDACLDKRPGSWLSLYLIAHFYD